MSEEEEKTAVKEEPKKLDFKNYLNAYEFETTLPGSKEVIKFKPITTGQLKRLLVYENETNPMMVEKALDELITSCIVSKDFSINKLYLQDRFFLLVEIRRKSKGDTYQFQYKCPDCESQSIQNINLAELTVTGIPDDIESVVKIDDNLSVRLTHITRGGQNIAFGNIKNSKKLSNTQRITEMALFTHAVAITGIIVPEGEIKDASIEDRKYLLENIPADSYGSIRDWFNENDFGMDFTYTIKCTNDDCEYEDKVDIPIENFFF